MDILRIATAGSVDDGKSTLIGRILYDTKSISQDKLEAIETSSRRKGLDFVDLSLLTDGLIAEREQGITIDVAHIYFSTPNRKYIIADTPGHVEYTRNMVTGASNTETSIVLIDARNGVIEQTKRHLFIASMLRFETVFICVNKMDLVEYNQSVFSRIQHDVQSLADKIGLHAALYFIPVAAKDGDNIVTRSNNMTWYQGQTLMDYLEALPVHEHDHELPARLPVQLVVRPHAEPYHDYRGYAGKLISGLLTKGQEVTVLPTLQRSKIKAILHAGTDVDVAMPGQSITIQLETDIDVSRGNMIVPPGVAFQQLSHCHALLTWMDEQPLTSGRTFLLQHGVNRVKAKVTELRSQLDIQSMEELPGAVEFRLNDIGRVALKLAKPIFADTYHDNAGNGVFILIDEFSNNTVAVGFIE